MAITGHNQNTSKMDPACLLSFTGATNKYNFYRNKGFVSTKLLLRQTYCHDKTCRDKLTFVMTNMCLSQRNTSFVSQQMFCHDKHMDMTKDVFCDAGHEFVFVAIKLL